MFSNEHLLLDFHVVLLGNAAYLRYKQLINCYNLFRRLYRHINISLYSNLDKQHTIVITSSVSSHQQFVLSCIKLLENYKFDRKLSNILKIRFNVLLCDQIFFIEYYNNDCCDIFTILLHSVAYVNNIFFGMDHTQHGKMYHITIGSTNCYYFVTMLNLNYYLG